MQQITDLYNRIFPNSVGHVWLSVRSDFDEHFQSEDIVFIKVRSPDNVKLTPELNTYYDMSTFAFILKDNNEDRGGIVLKGYEVKIVSENPCNNDDEFFSWTDIRRMVINRDNYIQSLIDEDNGEDEESKDNGENCNNNDEEDKEDEDNEEDSSNSGEDEE